MAKSVFGFMIHGARQQSITIDCIASPRTRTANSRSQEDANETSSAIPEQQLVETREIFRHQTSPDERGMNHDTGNWD